MYSTGICREFDLPFVYRSIQLTFSTAHFKDTKKVQNLKSPDLRFVPALFGTHSRCVHLIVRALLWSLTNIQKGYRIEVSEIIRESYNCATKLVHGSSYVPARVHFLCSSRTLCLPCCTHEVLEKLLQTTSPHSCSLRKMLRPSVDKEELDDWVIFCKTPSAPPLGTPCPHAHDLRPEILNTPSPNLAAFAFPRL